MGNPAAEIVPRTSAVRLLMLIGLYALPVLVTVRSIGTPVFDPDIWWHLRTGQWVVEHRAVPVLDPFSQTTTPWVAYSWLFELGIYGLYGAFGLAGIIIYRAGMALAIAAALHRLVARREPHFLAATGLTGIGLLAVAGLFSERPWLFTILFSILTLSAVLDLREGRRSWLAPLLPLVFVLWANVHIQFVYGLGILGMACLAPLLDRWLAWARGIGPVLEPPAGATDNEPQPSGEMPPGTTAATAWTRAWGRLVLLTSACCLATWVNPYGWRLYQVVIEYATQPGPYRVINELKAPEFREPCDWATLALAAAATFSLGRRRRTSTFEMLLLVVAAAFAFRARRDLWFLVAASLAVLMPPGRAARLADRLALSWRGLGWVCASVALLAGATAWWRDLSPRHLDERLAEVFPVDAARFVAASTFPPGPLFNDFNWGGYLIWALPHRPVAIDGRTNLHGDERLLRIGNTWAAGPGWDGDPDLDRAGLVIAPAGSPLVAVLECSRRFRRVHEDKVACVFARTEPEHEVRTDLELPHIRNLIAIRANCD